jgi:hypothetical protein
MGWDLEQAEAAWWELPRDVRNGIERLERRRDLSGIDFSTVIKEDLIMMDQDPTLEEREAFEDEGRGGSPLEGRYENPELYVDPAPQPAHVRDGVTTVALSDAQAQVRERRNWSERDGLRAALVEARAEVERLTNVVGHGPYVIVKLPTGWFEGDQPPVTQPVEVRVGFGGGVTRHLLQPVLSLGQQAVAEEDARRASQKPPGQVRAMLGKQGSQVTGKGGEAFQCSPGDCRCGMHTIRPAGKPQEVCPACGNPEPCYMYR